MEMNFLHFFLFYYYDRESCMSLETRFKLKKQEGLEKNISFTYFLSYISIFSLFYLFICLLKV